MIGRRVLVGCLIITSFAFFGVTRAAAQGCAGQTTVLGSVEGSDHVVILRVLTIDPPPPIPDGESESALEPEVQKLTVEVVRVYKGGMKPREILTFGQYAGSEGGWSFDSTDVGREFLFYLDTDSFMDGLWWPNNCVRSNRLELATDDLLYLDKQRLVMGKTRVSGTMSYLNNDGAVLEGITVRFTGANRSYLAKTDARGVYEIYDLPPGKYMVAATLPSGWKLDEDSWYVYPGEEAENAPELAKFQIKVVSKKHVAVDLFVEAENAIRGRIFFPFGGSLAGDYIKATRADGSDNPGYFTAQIEPDGSFNLTGLPGGGYVIVVNEGGVVSSSMPFQEFYYPGVTDRALAAVLYITPGQAIDGININAPQPAETVIVSGRLLYADGSPVPERMVNFTSTNTNPMIYGDVSASTDAEGKFSFRVLKGLSGDLAGHFFSYVGEYADSPELDAAILAAAQAVPVEEPTGGEGTPEAGAIQQPIFANLSTETLTIEAGQDRDEIVLQLPFTARTKAPQPAQ